MKANDSGFTLIEVLIAVIILASGLIGLSALQAQSLNNNQSAYYRSQATQLAYDIAERMRANKVQVDLGSTSKYIALLPSAATENTACNAPPGCTPQQMAENDLFQWNRDVTNTLPMGQGLINLDAGSPGTFTITLSWDDNRDGDVDGDDGVLGNDADGDGDLDDDPNFRVRFQII